MEVISSSVDCLSLIQCYGIDAIEGNVKIPRPLNAFMIFGKNYRKVLANKFKDLSNKQISKILGHEWKQMDEKIKSYYHSLAEEAQRQHHQKYPGYYYNPLEARQRKAERKRKSKMSRTSHKSHRKDYPIIQTFGGNRPFLLETKMHSILKPMFANPMPSIPTMKFSQPMVRYEPNQPFGGFGKSTNIGTDTHPRPAFVVPINIEHNYAIQHKTDPSVQQIVSFETQRSEVEVKVETESKDIETSNLTETNDPDMELLSSFMPPMHNPMIEVTPVVHSEGHTSETGSASEMIKMTNVSIDCELISTQMIKQEVIEEVKDQLCHKDIKPIVQ